MAPFASILPPRRAERGGISWVTLLLLAVLVGGGYLAVVWAPVYVLNYEVKQVVRDFANQAIKNPNDAVLLDRMCHKIRSLQTVRTEQPDGSLADVPVVDLQVQDVTWERDTSATPPTLHVAFEYVRQVQYPLLDKVTEWTGSVDFTNELVVPDWGPTR